MAGLARLLDRHPRTGVIAQRRITMKAANDMSLWSIIERLQRRLERQGMKPAETDRAITLAVKALAGR
jgi:hypothetical protein